MRKSNWSPHIFFWDQGSKIEYVSMYFTASTYLDRYSKQIKQNFCVFYFFFKLAKIQTLFSIINATKVSKVKKWKRNFAYNDSLIVIAKKRPIPVRIEKVGLIPLPSICIKKKK